MYSYLTAHGALRIWGEIVRAFPKPEGDLFPAVVPVVLAAIAVAAHAARLWRMHRQARPPAGAPYVVERLTAAVALFYATCAVVIIFTGGFSLRVGPLPVRLTSLPRTLMITGVAFILLLIVSPRARAVVRGVRGSSFAFFAVATVIAWWLSLGPVLASRGMHLPGKGLYRVFYEAIPGFDGLRVPARYGMIVMLFLAVVAGFGAAEICRRWRRGTVAVLAVAMLFLLESTTAPIILNGTWEETDIMTPRARLLMGNEVPQVYRYLAALPDDVVVAEFPFGSDQYELRYLYYSTFHWRKLVNGYSGGFPPAYMTLRGALRNLLADLDRGWQVLARSGATHAVVHEGSFRGGDGRTVSAWLESHGARLVGVFGTDKVYQLPRASSNPSD